MEVFESPTYVLDLRDSRNRATIESVKPNKQIRVLVRPENDPLAAPIIATGKLSDDGAVFDVLVVTRAGRQSHSWTWNTLQDALRGYRDH